MYKVQYMKFGKTVSHIQPTPQPFFLLRRNGHSIDFKQNENLQLPIFYVVYLMMQDAEFILGLPDLLVRDFWYSFGKLHRSEYLTIIIIILIEILNSSLPMYS